MFEAPRPDPFSTGTVEGESAIHFHRYQVEREKSYFHHGTALMFDGDYDIPDSQVFVFVLFKAEEVLDKVEAIWASKDETLTLTHSELRSFQGFLGDVKVLSFRSWGGCSLRKPVELLGAKNNWMRIRKLGV